MVLLFTIQAKALMKVILMYKNMIPAWLLSGSLSPKSLQKAKAGTSSKVSLDYVMMKHINNKSSRCCIEIDVPHITAFYIKKYYRASGLARLLCNIFINRI